MKKLFPSKKSEELVKMYEQMALSGYVGVDGSVIDSAFNDMEIIAFKSHVKTIFEAFDISTLLDYGCGGSDYEKSGFDGVNSAAEYFSLDKVFRYEPARGIDERQPADAVVCFDVLEHIFISDVPRIVRELYSLAGKLLVVNVACYSARALLPNGENAHITVRPPMWWKGMFDAIAVEFPHVAVQLWCSTGWRQVQEFEIYSCDLWNRQDGFVNNM